MRGEGAKDGSWLVEVEQVTAAAAAAEDKAAQAAGELHRVVGGAERGADRSAQPRPGRPYPCPHSVNQLKLEHYLLEFIEDSINSKGLIVASREMALKLAANIVEREKEGRLFEFANSRQEKYVGEELWRLYCRQSERKARQIVNNYLRK